MEDEERLDMWGGDGKYAGTIEPDGLIWHDTNKENNQMEKESLEEIEECCNGYICECCGFYMHNSFCSEVFPCKCEVWKKKHTNS